MARYHINPETGRPNICRAKTPESCIYAQDGEVPEHYDSKEEAREAYAKSMAEHLTATHSVLSNISQRVVQRESLEKDHYSRERMERDAKKINERLRALGFEEGYRIEHSDPSYKERKIGGLTYFAKLEDVTLHHPQLKHNGRVFLGSISSKGEITPAPGVDLHGYSSSDPLRCDHCGARRHRDNTVLVQNEDGNVMQVGSSCLQEYSGVPFSRIESATKSMHEFDRRHNRNADEGRFLSWHPNLGTDDALALSLAVSNKGEDYVPGPFWGDKPSAKEATWTTVSDYIRHPDKIPSHIYSKMQQYKKDGSIDEFKKKIEQYDVSFHPAQEGFVDSDECREIVDRTKLMKKPAAMQDFPSFTPGYLGKRGDAVLKGTKLKVRENKVFRNPWTEERTTIIEFEDEKGRRVIWHDKENKTDIKPGDNVTVDSAVIWQGSEASNRGESNGTTLVNLTFEGETLF